jgi:hypothetical protein
VVCTSDEYSDVDKHLALQVVHIGALVTSKLGIYSWITLLNNAIMVSI